MIGENQGMLESQIHDIVSMHNKEVEIVHEKLSSISEDLSELMDKISKSNETEDLINFINLIKDKVDDINLSTIIKVKNDVH